MGDVRHARVQCVPTTTKSFADTLLFVVRAPAGTRPLQAPRRPLGTMQGLPGRPAARNARALPPNPRQQFRHIMHTSLERPDESPFFEAIITTPLPIGRLPSVFVDMKKNKRPAENDRRGTALKRIDRHVGKVSLSMTTTQLHTLEQVTDMTRIHDQIVQDREMLETDEARQIIAAYRVTNVVSTSVVRDFQIELV